MPHVKQCCFQPAESPVTSPTWVPIKNQPMLATMDTNNFVSGLSGSMWINCTFSIVCHVFHSQINIKSGSSNAPELELIWLGHTSCDHSGYAQAKYIKIRRLLYNQYILGYVWGPWRYPFHKWAPKTKKHPESGM